MSGGNAVQITPCMKNPAFDIYLPAMHACLAPPYLHSQQHSAREQNGRVRM